MRTIWAEPAIRRTARRHSQRMRWGERASKQTQAIGDAQANAYVDCSCLRLLLCVVSRCVQWQRQRSRF